MTPEVFYSLALVLAKKIYKEINGVEWK